MRPFFFYSLGINAMFMRNRPTHAQNLVVRVCADNQHLFAFVKHEQI